MKSIPLTQNRWAIIDDSDYDLVSKHKWYALFDGYNWYAACKVNKKQLRLHNFLMNPPPGVFIDHEDRNGLNCQRSNLRICTHKENCKNRKKYTSNKSGYKGVCWVPKLKKWKGQARNADGVVYLGIFKTAEDAARAYDAFAETHYGQFAVTNKDLGLLT